MMSFLPLQTSITSEVLQNTTPAADMSLLELLMKGGWILLPIILISLISIYIMVYKYLEIRDLSKIDMNALAGFKAGLRDGNINKALSFLQAGHTSYNRIFQHAASKLGKPVSDLESAIETAAQIELSRMSKNLHYLGLFAGIAPMLGFIGTISGVIKIFYNISLTDNISIGIISGGLYQKMISSGTGLIVGVVAYTGYHLLSIMIDKYMSRIEEEAFEVVNIIQSNTK
jgi:biopolymer transport protein ExbB